MSPIIAGLGLIVLGLVGAFFGYRIFRVLLPIYGGVAGFLLAWGWWGQNAWLLALIVGVVLAVVFAVLAYAFWSAMVAFGGLIMGGAIGIAIGTSLNLWGWLTALLAIGLGIVFAALFFWIRNEMVIITTAIFGGTLAARGVGELFGWRSGVEGTCQPQSCLALDPRAGRGHRRSCRRSALPVAHLRQAALVRLQEGRAPRAGPRDKHRRDPRARSRSRQRPVQWAQRRQEAEPQLRA